MNRIDIVLYKWLLLFCLFTSCQSSVKYEHIQIINEWRGKEIILPARMEYKIMGRDTVCNDIWDKQYKIFTYVDSVGCTSCQLGISQWKNLIDSTKNKNVSFIFAVHSTNYTDFNYELLLDGFNHPIIFDQHNDFYKLNHFPKFPYRTFLLDKDNKVILIGTPTNNPKIWELYKQQFSQ